MTQESRAHTIIQLTDFHLGENSGDKLLGMDTDQSFADVVDLVTKNHSVIDRVLATGDLANHGSESAYQRLLEKFAVFSAPVIYLPGNHDDVPLMQQCFGLDDFPLINRVGNWCIVGLNSAQINEVGGTIEESQMHALKKFLSTNTAPVLIVLHHPPVSIDCAWLDPLGLSNGEELLELLVNFPQVKAVLCGHVHQEGTFHHQHLPIYSAPSTCIQFLPRNEHFALDDRNPGYRWLTLFSDGRFDTGVERVTGIYSVDHEAAGY